MDRRLALISGAVFAGVLVAGGIISSGSLNPADALGSLTRSDSPEQRIVQDQPAVADTSNTAARQSSEVSFVPSGERHDDHGDNDREDD
jgi:hypothetical protein